MNNIEELVYSAMQSSLEGYAVAVVDSIEFELKRELTTQEHQQVYVAVDSAITGIAAAQKELHDFKMKLSDAGCLLVEWKKRVEKAEKERDDLLNQEFQQRLANAEHQLYMKDLAIHNIKASRKAQFRKRLAAEAALSALSAANERLTKPVYQYCIRNLYNGQASEWQTIAPDQVNTVLRMNPENAEFQILAAGFTVEGE